MAAKRERCVNWEHEEKQLLREVLRPYLRIIENKDLKTNTNKEKMKAWIAITEKFNTANIRMRDMKQLQNQWKLCKINSKKESCTQRRESYRTGGGPKPPSPSQDAIEVAEMIPLEFEIGSNEFDCDGIQEIPSDKIEENIFNIDRNEYGNENILLNDDTFLQSLVQFSTPKLPEKKIDQK